MMLLSSLTDICLCCWRAARVTRNPRSFKAMRTRNDWMLHFSKFPTKVYLFVDHYSFWIVVLQSSTKGVIFYQSLCIWKDTVSNLYSFSPVIVSQFCLNSPQILLGPTAMLCCNSVFVQSERSTSHVPQELPVLCFETVSHWTLWLAD